MNWMTKAKSRIGRGGKGKKSVENQQRLTAFNKLPSRQSSRQATHVVPMTNDEYQCADDGRVISADMMMLGFDEYKSHSIGTKVDEISTHHKGLLPPLQGPQRGKTINSADSNPLGLLEFTVSQFFDIRYMLYLFFRVYYI
jgi:hypothetical protein